MMIQMYLSIPILDFKIIMFAIWWYRFIYLFKIHHMKLSRECRETFNNVVGYNLKEKQN